MVSENFERKLTAILSADVVGFSRHMGADEVGTLQSLNAHREIMDSLISERRGRVVGSAGDSLLAEFASPVEAVQTADEIQHALARHNAEAGRRMEWRIGINLGDVIIEGDNIFGDGVNVAARLESLALPSGLCISGTVFDQVENKLDLRFEYRGRQSIKNIAKPVRVYRLMGAGAAEKAAGRGPKWRAFLDRHRKWLGGAVAVALLLVVVGGLIPAEPPSGPAAPDSPAVAMRPFRNIGNSKEQVLFSEGLTVDLITALSRDTGMRVIAGGAADDSLGPREFGRRLGAGYVLEGTVRWAGGHMRITAQLVDARSGYNLWGGRYDRGMDDLLAVQAEVTGRIVGTLSAKLAEAEQARVAGGEGEHAGPGALALRALSSFGRLAERAIFLPRDLYRQLRGEQNGGEQP